MSGKNWLFVSVLILNFTKIKIAQKGHQDTSWCKNAFFFPFSSKHSKKMHPLNKLSLSKHVNKKKKKKDENPNLWWKFCWCPWIMNYCMNKIRNKKAMEKKCGKITKIPLSDMVQDAKMPSQNKCMWWSTKPFTLSLLYKHVQTKWHYT